MIVNNKKIFPGTVYFRFVPEKEEPELIRVLRIKNSDCFVIEKEGENVKINSKEFSTYTKLNPDALLCFSVVDLIEGQDIMVSLYRKEDQEDGFPYCVARMSAYDVFTNTINPREDGKAYLGMCLSKDTCPPNMKYCDCLACSAIHETNVIGVYYDDTLDNMLKYVNTVNYDMIANKVNESFDKRMYISNCHSVRQLLEQSHFMEDFWRAFNIIKTPWVYNEIFQMQQVSWIEDTIKREIIAPVIVKFTRDINLENIQDDYLLILDLNNRLYVMSYKRGEYINRPYKMQDDGKMLEIEMLEKMAGKVFPQFH